MGVNKPDIFADINTLIVGDTLDLNIQSDDVNVDVKYPIKNLLKDVNAKINEDKKNEEDFLEENAIVFLEEDLRVSVNFEDIFKIMDAPVKEVVKEVIKESKPTKKVTVVPYDHSVYEKLNHYSSRESESESESIVVESACINSANTFVKEKKIDPTKQLMESQDMQIMIAEAVRQHSPNMIMGGGGGVGSGTVREMVDDAFSKIKGLTSRLNLNFVYDGSMTGNLVIPFLTYTDKRSGYVVPTGKFSINSIVINFFEGVASKTTSVNIRLSYINMPSSFEYLFGDGTTLYTDTILPITGIYPHHYYIKSELIMPIPIPLFENTMVFVELSCNDWVFSNCKFTLNIVEG